MNSIQREYIQRAEDKGYTLAEWVQQRQDAEVSGVLHRWDVLNASGAVLATCSDRQRAEGWVDHHTL